MTEMTNLLIFTVLIWTAGLTEGITTHSGCSDTINLSCPYFDMIHVERITYYNGTDCNQALTDQQVCGLPLTGSDTGLAPVCTGKTSCDEILHKCPGSNATRVDYRCVKGNKVKDMCDETDIDNTDRIFLSTPNYPFLPPFTNISPCRCNIRGSNITSIEILELALPTSDDGTKSSLEINYGDVTYRTESLNGTTRRVYNKRLTSTSTAAAEIIFNHNNINNQYIWIEIQGNSMNVSCNNETKSTSTSPSTASASPSPSSSPTTSSSPSSFQTTSSQTTSSSQPSNTSTLSSSSTTSPSSSTTNSTSSTTTSSSPSTVIATSSSPTTSSSPFSTTSTTSSTATSSSNMTSTSATDESNTTEEPASTPTPRTTSTSSSTMSFNYTSVIAGSVVGGVILIVIIIIIFICRKRSQNRSPTTKPDTEKIDVNPDYISMDYQRIHRGHPDGGEIDDDLTKADDDVDLNEVIESDNSGQTASKTNKDVVYAEVNKPGRKPVGSESNSVAPNFTLEDVYSVVNKTKNKRNSLEADDKSPERIITENELYVPFDDEASDRIVMENDLYVPMEDTLLTKVL